MAMDVMTQAMNAYRSVGDPNFNAPADGDDVEVMSGVLVNIEDYPAHNQGKTDAKKRDMAECQIQLTYRKVNELRLCRIMKGGNVTGQKVVCCAPGHRCTPVSYKNAQDLLDGMGYWGSLPDACGICWLPQQFCCCHALCKNCFGAPYRMCHTFGCNKPGKAYLGE